MSSANGTTDLATYSYDDQGRVTRIDAGIGASNSGHVEFGYDVDSDLTSQTLQKRGHVLISLY
ncbi:MAG: hypothetical protein JJ889_13330 [Maricaulis sp.]|nr:hypothetical protein [Maricaulis sp.]